MNVKRITWSGQALGGIIAAAFVGGWKWAALVFFASAHIERRKP